MAALQPFAAKTRSRRLHLRNRIVPMSTCRGFRFAALLLIASVSGEVLPLKDDECWAGGCSLQILQLQAQVSGTQNASSDYERSCTLVDCRKNKQDKRCGYYRRCVDKKPARERTSRNMGRTPTAASPMESSQVRRSIFQDRKIFRQARERLRDETGSGTLRERAAAKEVVLRKAAPCYPTLSARVIKTSSTSITGRSRRMGGKCRSTSRATFAINNLGGRFTGRISAQENSATIRFSTPTPSTIPASRRFSARQSRRSTSTA